MLDKIVIANSKTIFIRDELHNVGLNQKGIFPDLAGLAQHICWEYNREERLARVDVVASHLLQALSVCGNTRGPA